MKGMEESGGGEEWSNGVRVEEKKSGGGKE